VLEVRTAWLALVEVDSTASIEDAGTLVDDGEIRIAVGVEDTCDEDVTAAGSVVETISCEEILDGGFGTAEDGAPVGCSTALVAGALVSGMLTGGLATALEASGTTSLVGRGATSVLDTGTTT
jgi:hypothetical protein